MTNLKYLLPTCFMAAFCLSCSHPTPVEKAEPKPAAESTAFRLYVTNEASGDMTVIDSAT